MTDSCQSGRWRGGNGLVSKAVLPGDSSLEKVSISHGNSGRDVIHPDLHTLMVLGEVSWKDGSGRDCTPDSAS